MATKKESEATHESLANKIAECEKALSDAKAEYKAFCKCNPFTASKQPTLHELRLMREKNSKPTLADHQKSNAAAAQEVAKQSLKESLKE